MGTPHCNNAEIMSNAVVFLSLLNDLGRRLEEYLLSDDRRILEGKCLELMVGAFNQWESVYAGETSGKLASEIATASPDFFQVIHDFMSAVFSMLPVIDHDLSEAWVFAHGLVLGLSRHKEVVEVIMKKGLLPYHIKELRALRTAKKFDWVVKTLVLSDLNVLYNCARNTSIEAYYHEFHFPTLLRPFLVASDSTMVIHAKLILAYVSSILTDEEINETMALSPRCCNELTSILAEASTSQSERAKGFDVCELVEGLRRLLVCQQNVSLLATSNRLCIVFVTLLGCGGLQVQTAACQLLWRLMKNEKFRDKIRGSDFPFAEVLIGIKEECKDIPLQLLASCTLMALEGTYDTAAPTLPTLEVYAKGCYEYGHYDECVEICSKHVDKATVEANNRVSLLLAKSLYHIYRRQAFIIEELKNTRKLQAGREFNALFQNCYDNARKVIDILASLLDANTLDDEGSKMLDIAMIDYSRETNKLNECNRCLMCRKKAKLCRSHVFPRTILEKFCSSLSRPGSKKNVTSIRQGKLESAKTLTTFLLCLSCEEILNKGGEEKFSHRFLDTIYDKNNPSSPTSSHDIQYGSWLYNFCVGLVFRGIGQYFPHCYSNSELMYQFFAQCRHYLLGNSCALSNARKLPNIAVILNPTSAEAKKIPGFINFALNYPLSTTNSSLPLDGVIPTTAERIYYLLIHFGIINVILLVEPSQICLLPDDTILHPEGGVLPILEDSKRGDIIPKGLWKFFEQTAVELETEHVQMSLSRLKWQEDNVLVEPNEDKVELYGFMPSFDKDTKNFGGVISSATIADVEKTIDFLPSGFHINHRSHVTSVTLPDNHKLILHYTFTNEIGKGESVFLAIDDELKRPYIIYHCYHLGLQMHVAFFVNSETSEAEEYLQDKNSMIRVDDVEKFTKFRKRISKILPQMVLSKGIISLSSLLCRTRVRREANYDRRCPAEDLCWYCKDRCDLCMSVAGFGLSKPVVGGKEGLYNFCSDACLIATGKAVLQPTIDFWDPTQNPPASFSTTCALLNTHKELLYIFAEFATENGYQSYDITLCKGDGSKPFAAAKVYAVCTYRRGINQLLFEFLLSDNFEYQGLVRVCDCDDLSKEFTSSAHGTLEMIIKQTLGFKCISTVSALLDMYEDKGKFNT